VKARRLEFGYLKTISGVDEKSFPMLIRTVSMKELLVIFPSLLVGTVLLLKQEVVYAMIPFMLAFFVLSYNEKSVPFYYQFVAFVKDLLTPNQKGRGKRPKEGGLSGAIRYYFERYENELELSVSTFSLTAVLYAIQSELYAGGVNVGVLVGLSVIAGLLIAFVVVKLTGLASRL
jgi:hypothetical protein